jgi:hypothetical protein
VNNVRSFVLHRDQDITGVSGTGVVAVGAMFSDGTTVIRWLGEAPSTVVWAHIGHAKKVHGHGGATRFVWDDDGHGRLNKIAQAHSKNSGEMGLTSGLCDECDHLWPCPTYVWATEQRDSVLACWDPADDEDPS